MKFLGPERWKSPVRGTWNARELMLGGETQVGRGPSLREQEAVERVARQQGVDGLRSAVCERWALWRLRWEGRSGRSVGA